VANKAPDRLLAKVCEKHVPEGYIPKARVESAKGDEALSELTDRTADSRDGHRVFDVEGVFLGTIVGRAYARRRFGVTWLLVKVADGRTVPVPAEQMEASGEGLVLPYVRAYVEAAPLVQEGLSASQADERRLRYHYGLVSGGPSGGCRVGCGLCIANKRELRRSAARECDASADD
jgi:hypothetical protein